MFVFLFERIIFTDKHLNDMAIKVCGHIRTTNPTHPLFEHENCLNRVIERGKTNLDHDLFDETNTIFIFDSLRQVVFSHSQLVCYCNHDINCFLLQQVYVYFNNFIVTFLLILL